MPPTAAPPQSHIHLEEESLKKVPYMHFQLKHFPCACIIFSQLPLKKSLSAFNENKQLAPVSPCVMISLWCRHPGDRGSLIFGCFRHKSAAMPDSSGNTQRWLGGRQSRSKKETNTFFQYETYIIRITYWSVFLYWKSPKISVFVYVNDCSCACNGNCISSSVTPTVCVSSFTIHESSLWSFSFPPHCYIYVHYPSSARPNHLSLVSLTLSPNCPSDVLGSFI